EILHVLYGNILIPQSVADELSHPAGPTPVRDWIVQPPSWLQIAGSAAGPGPVSLRNLGSGERDAILLALRLGAKLTIMDEREGVEKARRLGLRVTGTLGVLDRAAEGGLIELASVIAKLRQTNFRASPALIDGLLAAHRGKTK